VLADPKKLRDREIGKRRVTSELDQTLGADFLRQRAALRFGPHIAPDKRGTDHLTAIIEHYGAVHLAGEADAGDIFAAQFGRSQRLANSDAASSPPIVGMLLGPANRGRRKRRMLLGSRRGDRALFVKQQGACSAGANVNAQEINRISPLANA
jgi:hypothetical protein